MTIQINTNSGSISEFSSATVRRSLDSLSGSFDVTIRPQNLNLNSGKPFPFRVGDFCQIYVDGVVQMTGYIEAVNVDSSVGAHSLTFSGRDMTADVIDSNVGQWAAFTGGSLLDLIGKTLLDAYIYDVGLVVNSDLRADLIANPFTEGESAAANIGDTVFNYLESYARKRQVLMTTNGYGDIELVRTYTVAGDNERSTNAITGGHNIKSSNLRLDASRRFHYYRVSSVDNPTADFTVRSESEIQPLVEDTGAVGRVHEVTDTTVRPSRSWHIAAEKSATPKDCLDRAVWERNLALGRYLIYTATVYGHSDSGGEPWKLNTLYPITDDACGMKGEFLLSGIEWGYSVDAGTTSSLTFVVPEAYANASKKAPKAESRADALQADFEEWVRAHPDAYNKTR